MCGGKWERGRERKTKGGSIVNSRESKLGECGGLSMRNDSTAPSNRYSKYRAEISGPESNYFHIQDKD